MSEDQALTFLAQLDASSVREGFLPNVGPGSLHDTDDPARCTSRRAALTLPNIEASTIIADEAGIHWKTIRRTAELVKYSVNTVHIVKGPHSPRPS